MNYRYDSIDFSTDMKKYLIEEGYNQFMAKIKEKKSFQEEIQEENIDNNTISSTDIDVLGDVVKDLMDIVSGENQNIPDIEEIVNES